MSPKAIFLTTITLLILNLIATAAPSPHTECVEELVALSPCLPFVSASPNNFTAAVSQKCCGTITFPFNSTCICHLLQLKQIFGFPLNRSRVLLLPSVCSGKTTRLPELQSMCSLVAFSGGSLSQLEQALQKCDVEIKGTCPDTQCCHNLCAKQLPSAKNIDVSYKVVNGTPTCFCHGC